MSSRAPHAVLDLESRCQKAMKIYRLLGLDDRPNSTRLLEVGCGGGGISHWFATQAGHCFDVDAVDVVDLRVVSEGYRFTLVEGVALPFPDSSFDVVLSNHVIEHVGDDQSQAHHLSEIRRVLRDNGIAYLAVPNRWMLVEPHYSLAFLSWWPEGLRSVWLRIWRRGGEYDCRPLSRKDLEQRLVLAGFTFRQLHFEALKATFEIEDPRAKIWRIFRHTPAWLHQCLRGVYPTLIYTLRKNSTGAEHR